MEVLDSSRAGIWIHAPLIDLHAELTSLPSDHPIGSVILKLFQLFDISQTPNLEINISSTIPVAAGLGSGAAVSVALIARSLLSFRILFQMMRLIRWFSRSKNFITEHRQGLITPSSPITCLCISSKASPLKLSKQARRLPSSLQIPASRAHKRIRWRCAPFVAERYKPL